MNEQFNQKINCNVCDCSYNKDGHLCEKNAICVCCSEKGCTCCGSFVSKSDAE